MLKLHGIRMSNYYSVTKTCLLEKGAEFEEVKSPPSQDEEYLAKSPMGKVPALETDSGFISETLAIAGYLEATQPGPALISEDPSTARGIRFHTASPSRSPLSSSRPAT